MCGGSGLCRQLDTIIGTTTVDTVPLESGAQRGDGAPHALPKRFKPVHFRPRQDALDLTLALTLVRHVHCTLPLEAQPDDEI
jgi:hypothetical protein